MTAQKSLGIALDASNNGTIPKGARLALAGLVEGAAGGPLAVNLGVFEDDFTPVVSGAANMSYNVRAFVAVMNPTGSAANGVVIGANDATVNVATTVAPGSNSRVDVIWARQHVVASDGGSDTDNILEIGVTQGTAAAAPAIPNIPIGALALGYVTVTSGTAATNTLTPVRAHQWVKARGNGGLRQMVVFNTAGTTPFVKNDYPWARYAKIRVQAAGGGGGGCIGNGTAGTASAGGGGGAGGYAELVVALSALASSENVVVGGGGNGSGAGGSPGATGGNSSLGAWCAASGGSGGVGATSASSIASFGGGSGGAGTAGDFGLTGSVGASGFIISGTPMRSAIGGTSPLGGAGGSAGVNANGGDAGGYGGGGGGGSTNNATSRSGGKGGDGCVIVELFG